MIYKCKKCKYSTNDKSNINRHNKSYSHLSTIEPTTHKFICKKCNKEFSCKQSLSRHTLHYCRVHEEATDKNAKIQELESKLLEYQCLMKVKELEIELKHANQKINELQVNPNNTNNSNNQPNNLTNNNTNNQTNNITYKISVKNYVQQHYPEAPPLLCLPDYEQLTYDEETNEPDDDFISTLVYNYNNHCLHKYLGDFLIKYYKKDDPSQQSVWSSDISRLTYVIKELLANKESIWNHDYKGIKTKEYIVSPLLNYIKTYMDKFWVENLDNFKRLKIDIVLKLQNTYHVLYKIKKSIDTDVLGNDIIKYIAPHFRVNRTDNKQNLLVDIIND